MPVTGESRQINEGGSPKEAFTVNFTNGALDQLKELQLFFNEKELIGVVQLAIAFLQRVKENTPPKKQP
jgi:hypothetical protein